MLVIRAEEAADADAIRQVNLQAFGQPAEADLVEAEVVQRFWTPPGRCTTSTISMH